MQHGLGWNPDLEAQHAAAMTSLWQPVCAVSDNEIPASIDYGDALTVNDQGPRNSCCGNGVDKALEGDHYIDTGKTVNLSARFSYLAARIMDQANDGPDAGASIQGGALGSVKYGSVLEEQFPYWRDTEAFDPYVPEAILRLASEKRVRAAAPLRSYDDWLRFIGSRQGTAVIGIWWTDALANYAGQGPVINDRGRRVGGHALAAFEYLDVNGEKFPIIRNSHGKHWGRNGRMWVAPAIFDGWLRNAPFGAMGISGVPRFVKRTKAEMIEEAFA